MTRQELEAWLCGDDAPVPTAAEAAAVLGLVLDGEGTHDARGEVARRHTVERLVGARFTLAVLRDVFADDHAVRGWLRRPRAELGGLCGLDMLWAGRPRPVEDLAVREWHGSSGPVVLAATRAYEERSA